MARYSPGARKAISRRIDEYVDEIDSPVLADQVAHADDGAPETLYYLAEAVANSDHGADTTRYTDADETPVHDAISDAWKRATDALDLYIEQLVAQQVAEAIQTADEWADPERRPDYRDPEDYVEAKQEARGWLQNHLNAARRAGVLESVKLDRVEPEGVA